MKYFKYEPRAGECIDEAIKRSLELACRHNRPVRFRFNDTLMRVNKRLSVRHLNNQWQHMRYASQVKYESSAEGRWFMAECAASLRKAQEDTDDWIALLPSIVQDMDKLMQWLKQFSQSAARVGVVYDHTHVLQQMRAAGYQVSQHAGMGHPPEWFCTRKRLGEYIAGQAIACLVHRKGPHPNMTPRFVAQYETLPHEQPGSSFEANP